MLTISRLSARSAGSATPCAPARIHRGLGLCVFLDLSLRRAPRPTARGARISFAGRTTAPRSSGAITVIASVTEQGRGTDTILARVAATAVGWRWRTFASSPATPW